MMHCSLGLSIFVQVLPLVPPEEEFWSPYTGLDALCGNTLMISLDDLVEEGLLDKADLPSAVDPAVAADFFKVCLPSPKLTPQLLLPLSCLAFLLMPPLMLPLVVEPSFCRSEHHNGLKTVWCGASVRASAGRQITLLA